MWLLDKILTRLVHKGQITLVEADGTCKTFGTHDPDYPDLELRLHDNKVAGQIVRDPRLGLAEAYMDGRATIGGGDIMDLIGMIRANNKWESGRQIEQATVLRKLKEAAIGKMRQINHRSAARANVAHHYDLSSKLYDLFLDKERQYSCAYWTGPDKTLEEAQIDKLRHIAAKLHLQPGMKVLDIGCGWGGMALFLHRHYGVDVTGITLSTEQFTMARERAEQEGVTDHVRFELIDYRDMKGQFDRIVSVGMFEHVGTPNYRDFFRMCHNLLNPEGVMLLHSIGRMGGPSSTDAFTQKYIFPGGYIPALSEIVRASEPNRLMVTDVESLRLHYARTLRAWYERVQENQSEIEALYDARFFRMWSFYLAGAAASFENGGLLVYQLQYARDRHTLPVTRDYMQEAERALAVVDA